MSDIAGAKLITAAYLFGLAGIGFCLLPFLGVIVKGIIKGNGGSHNSKQGGDIVNIIGWAFIIHTIAAMLFMGLILILDEVNIDTVNYYTTKVFPIFWADTQAEVYNLAGVTTSDTESEIAYTTLNIIQTGVRLFLTFLPFIIGFLGVVYGFLLASKDTYNSNYLSMFVYTVISFIAAMLLYLFWAKISSFALFIPGGSDLVTIIADIWKDLALN
jgi:hypothetical protein